MFVDDETIQPLSQPAAQRSAGRRPVSPTIFRPTGRNRLMDSAQEAVELLAASYVADGMRTRDAARLAADQLVNNHPDIVTELRAEAAAELASDDDGSDRQRADTANADQAVRFESGPIDGGAGQFPFVADVVGNAKVSHDGNEGSAVLDTGSIVLGRRQAAALSRQLADTEFGGPLDATSQVGMRPPIEPGLRRFVQAFTNPNVDDDAFGRAAEIAGLDPNRFRLFREMLHVDDTSVDVVADQISTAFANSPPTEQFLLGTLERINATGDTSARAGPVAGFTVGTATNTAVALTRASYLARALPIAAGLAAVDGPLPVGDLVGLGLILSGAIADITIFNDDAARDDDESTSTDEKSAKERREENIRKGVPEREIGPSGRPKVHTVDHASKKRGKDAAQNKSGKGGTVVHHPSPKRGGPHYHSVKKDGTKGRTHHAYPKRQK